MIDIRGPYGLLQFAWDWRRAFRLWREDRREFYTAASIVAARKETLLDMRDSRPGQLYWDKGLGRDYREPSSRYDPLHPPATDALYAGTTDDLLRESLTEAAKNFNASRQMEAIRFRPDCAAALTHDGDVQAQEDGPYLGGVPTEEQRRLDHAAIKAAADTAHMRVPQPLTVAQRNAMLDSMWDTGERRTAC